MPNLSRRPTVSRASRDVWAAGAFLLLAVVWTYPLVLHLATALLGAGPGDNVTGLWNVWWMRTALATGHDFFQTSYLFAPVGVDLTLDTHTALSAFVGATVLAPFPVASALNLTVLSALFLNGWCAYRLALTLGSDWGSAVVAGLIFAGATDVTAHLNGHFNLIAAWTLPLFALTWLRALDGSIRWGVGAGLALGLTIYTDYYYAVYALLLGVGLIAFAALDWTLYRARGAPRPWVLWPIATAAVADLVLIVAIAATHPFTLTLGSRRIAVGTFNPLQLLWVLVIAWLIVRFQPRVHLAWRSAWPKGPAVRAIGAAFGVTAIIASPIVWNAVALIRRGDYVSQRYFWRSAPGGVDLASFVLGNPFHPIWGPAIQKVYAALGLNVIESSGGWLGLVPLAVAVWAVRRLWHRRTVRVWTALGVVFLVWALGPHLTAFGRQTGMILPETLVRYVPLASNARMPGRAMIGVDLAVAMLAAIALPTWRQSWRHPRRGLVIVAALVIIDLIPSPFPVYTLDHPHLYDVLRERPAQGAVCELPLGLRDGSGVVGALDPRVLYYQTIHDRPLVGGFVARLPSSVLAAYRSDPLLGGLLTLSVPNAAKADASLPDSGEASRLLHKDGIAFVVLNRTMASPALIAYVDHVLPLVRLGDDPERTFYEVQAP